MKLSLQTEDLTACMAAISRVASSKAVLQSLSGALIVAQEGKVEVRGADQQMALSLPLAASIEEEGEALVPARLLSDVARQLPGDIVELSIGEGESELAVKSGNASFSLRTLRAEDFPATPDPLDGEGVELSAREFFAAVSRVSRAASSDETRPILTGVLVSVEDDTLQMVATDSYRMALQKTTLPEPVSRSFEATIPARSLDELARLAGDEDEITVVLQESKAVFLAGDAVFSTSLLAGAFPDFRQLIPAEFEHELTLPTEPLADMTRRLSLLAKQNAPIQLSFSEGKLKMMAQTPDVGEAEESMDAPFSGEEMDIGFAPEYLLAGLDSVGCDELSLKLISPLRPALLVAGDGSGFLYLLMPVRLSA